MKEQKPLVSAAELEALIQNWGSSPDKSIDKFYIVRLAFNVSVMLCGAFWLLMDPLGIAQTLSSDPENIERVVSYLYFRGWFILGILILGFYSYFKNWYPAIVFCCCLLLGAMNLVSDLFTLYPERLTKPTPFFTLLLLVRLSLLWVMYMSIKNVSRMPHAKDRINVFLPFKRTAGHVE